MVSSFLPSKYKALKPSIAKIKGGRYGAKCLHRQKLLPPCIDCFSGGGLESKSEWGLGVKWVEEESDKPSIGSDGEKAV